MNSKHEAAKVAKIRDDQQLARLDAKMDAVLLDLENGGNRRARARITARGVRAALDEMRGSQVRAETLATLRVEGREARRRGHG